MRSPFLLLAAALLVPLHARTQSQPDPVVQNPEVLVRDTPVQDTNIQAAPVALSRDETPPAGVWDQLGSSLPNFHVFQGGAGGYGSLFSLRGLSNTPYFSEPALTVYFGDIPLPGSFAYPLDVFGFASAALVDGPAGTRFGRATDGGVLLFTPPQGATSAGGQFTASAGSYADRKAGIEVHGLPTGSADAEFMAGYDARDGYIENHLLGTRVDDQEDESAFARVRVRPSKGGEVSLELLQTRSRDGAQPLVPLSGPLYAVSRPMEGVTDLDSVGAALRLSQALGDGGVLSSVTSYTDWRMDPYRDYLTTPAPLESSVTQDQKSWNEEVHLSLRPSPDVRFDSGLWLSRGSTDSFVSRALFGRIPVDVSGFNQGDSSGAAFAEVSFDATPLLTFSAGVRAEDDEKHFTRREQAPVPGLAFEGEGRYRAILPHVLATLNAGPRGVLDAAIAFGMRPGGFASFTDNPALIPFATERSTAYSFGWKSARLGRSWDVGLDAFYTAIGNYQVERSFSPTDYLVAAAPRAHSQGVEFSGRWSATAWLDVRANAGLLQTRLDRFTAPLTGQIENGNPAPGVPALTAGLEATIRPGRGWFGTGRLTTVGRTHFDELSTAHFSQDAYSVLDVEAGYRAARWSLAAYCANAGATSYYALIVPGVLSGVPGAPRTLGAKVSLRY